MKLFPIYLSGKLGSPTPINMELPGKLSEYVSWFERELDSVVQFWLAHSHDKKHGYA